MPSTVLSAATLGIDAYPVHVEVDTDRSLPTFTVVGLPDSAVRESKERVLAAIKNAGYQWPRRKITINLAPADRKKEGSAFDLPIAVGVLAASQQIKPVCLAKFALLGELSLNGNVRPVHGMLPMATSLHQQGLYGMIVPTQNAREAAIANGPLVYGVSSLNEALAILAGDAHQRPYELNVEEVFSSNANYGVDFAEVRGQDHAKRALEVAASGGHNLLMVGPPGSGKTMLARRLPTILPAPTLQEALDTTKIHSVAGILPAGQALVATRPFRAPHHTISDAGLIGGGAYPRPGEVSLSHHGVLFLDELPEFRRNVVEALRQPLEDHAVTITRAQISLAYPADFTLVAAMNPCPCGFLADARHTCTCSPAAIRRYRARVSGPLLDRIDIHIEVPTLAYDDLANEQDGENSAHIRQRVNAARRRQLDRFAGELFCNAQMGPRHIRRHCSLDDAGQSLLEKAMARLGLSARAYDRILKVARTIADLADDSTIQPRHLAEAIQYRALDRNALVG